jgi:hypothetical protein
LTGLNISEAYYGLRDVPAARSAFGDARRYADPASGKDLYWLASTAATIGADEDAVEFFARYVALAEGTPCGETPAVEIIRAASPETKAPLADLPLLAAAIERVTERWDAPIPEEHQFPARTQLPPEAWAKLLRDVVFARAVELADGFGCIGVYVHPKPDVVLFYARYGFVALHDEAVPPPMFLPMAVVESVKKAT